MARSLDIGRLLAGCADGSFDDGIRIDTDLEPLAGPGTPVKPAVYEGGAYQEDRRWASPDAEKPTPVIVIDNVPSQANRLENALQQKRDAIGVPELVLDLSEIEHLPAHLPRRLSSWRFPHRNADAYLRDAQLGDEDFMKTDLGRDLFGATPWSAGPLMAWFPQSLLYGFWQSHLGKKRQNTKHARAWVSEIVGWSPASTETKVKGLKGDDLNLNTDDVVTSNPDDRGRWEIGKAKIEGAKTDKLSEMGHGQVPFMSDNDAAAAAVSFARITQRSTISFAQLRRVSLGAGYSADTNSAARALLVALGLHAHALAFGRGFALRSGAELRVKDTRVAWLGFSGDEECELGDAGATEALLRSVRDYAAEMSVPLDGWDTEPIILTPRENLRKAIESTWPKFDD